MISLVNWYLEKYNNDEPYYIMRGYVFGHPRLADGVHIHTSAVEDIKLNDNRNKLSGKEKWISDIGIIHGELSRITGQTDSVPSELKIREKMTLLFMPTLKSYVRLGKSQRLKADNIMEKDSFRLMR